MLKLASVLLVGMFLVVPLFSFANGLVPCGGIGEQPCQSCDVVNLVNNVIQWLVVVLGTIAALVIIYAGVKLVMSGGNQAAMEESKSMITNIIIGYIIVLSGWLLIDFGMKALINEGAFGVWNAVQCIAQPVVKNNGQVTLDFETEITGLSNGGFTQNQCDVGPSGGRTQCANQTQQCTAQGGVPTVDSSDRSNYTVNCAFNAAGATCAAGPSGDRVLCAAQTKACTDRGGTPTTDTSNPKIYTVNCSTRGGSGSSDSFGGSCSVVTDASNACYPSKLGCFGDTQAASKICNLESAGGNTRALSGSDLCKDGRTFSGGLWQINILANYSLIPGCSSGFFEKVGSSAQGDCLQKKTNRNGVNYCAVRNCRITNVTVYNQCIAQILQPSVNTTIACSLHRSGGWKPWITSARACGVR